MHCLKLKEAQNKNLVAWISPIQKSSWIKITASRLSYKLGFNGGKKSIETSVIIKNEYSTFHTSKPENFSSLREEI